MLNYQIYQQISINDNQTKLYNDKTITNYHYLIVSFY